MPINFDDYDKKIDLAVGYAQSGDYYPAIKIYEELIEKNPDDTMILVNLGQALNAIGDYKRASETLIRVIEFSNTNEVDPQILSMAYTNLGAVNKALSNFDEAIRLYSTAIETDPSNQLAIKYLEGI